MRLFVASFLLSESQTEANRLEAELTSKTKKEYAATIAAIELRQQVTIESSLKAEEIVLKKIDGLTFKDRLYKRSRVFTNRIMSTINQGLQEGLSYADIAIKIRPLLDNIKSNSELIAWTEGHRIQEAARDVAYDDALKVTDFNVLWTSASDSRVRPRHRSLNGAKRGDDGYFEIDGLRAKYPGGFGVASMDCRCRCSTYIDFDYLA
jgi:SPP1 gp7 family putative phage head morphogenesis protein